MSNEEQNAAHSFDKEEDDIRGYYEPDDRPQSMKDLAEKLRLEKQIELAELTRLRSELQQKDEVISELKKDKEYLLDMVSKVMSLDALTPSVRAIVWQQANECLSDNAVLRYK